HRLLTELPDDAISAFVDVAGPESGAPLLLAEIRHLGGALGRPAENAGALEKLDEQFVMLGLGMLMDPALREPIDGALDRLADAMSPWAAERGYFNYAERPCGLDALLPAEICERLAQVKRSWDPDDLILANHPVASATSYSRALQRCGGRNGARVNCAPGTGGGRAPRRGAGTRQGPLPRRGAG